MTRVVCRAGLEDPFGQSAEVVWEHLGVRLDEEAGRGATEALGQVAEAVSLWPILHRRVTAKTHRGTSAKVHHGSDGHAAPAQ